MFFRIILIFLTSFVISVSGITQELTKLRYLPHWLAQAQFAGYYIAKEKGIYEKYGLDVEIQKGGPLYPSIRELKNGKCDIVSMFLSGAIKAKNKGVVLVDICQLSKRSALMFISKKKSGITKPEDFNGKKIGVWRSDFQELPCGFLKKYNIDATIVPITNTVNLFYYDGVDVLCVMWYNEYHQILNFGIDYDELDIFFFTNYGLNFPEDGIFCTEEFYKNNKKACQDFAKATLEGWKYAFEHEDESLELVIKYMQEANVPANIPHQKWMFNRMYDVYISENNKLNGELLKEDFLKTAKILLESGKINTIPDFDNFNKTK
ncbi:MAG: ABC transporter substrate-binding protein [Bacteroidales bacterium]|nr:ABC transporter substrate-binding protein [Bacteroidales bacterium]